MTAADALIAEKTRTPVPIAAANNVLLNEVIFAIPFLNLVDPQDKLVSQVLVPVSRRKKRVNSPHQSCLRKAGMLWPISSRAWLLARAARCRPAEIGSPSLSRVEVDEQ
jgi:hypothetical protein